ncbi:EAL domain-containing protein [Metabacillus fastidiosus]|uniref:bifunctional diguanylate cyclase/phosphodiesterase n=1 Tax=Metabacillus fastidiosus TaxID=1458 RepID=UPI000824497A|nr:EAL domain-containing protein [Metabacillus fastidiosus]MED4452230.1 EAL domain-containing protein [Metabacillus fastidiosus]MED4462392.1 EAL domain-containing protein [Metabacillus fastidiosus]
MFSLPDLHEITILHGEYSTRIVILSVLIACFASYTALSLNEKIQNNLFFHRYFWLTLASIAMGLGIWSMHFVGMSAFMLPVQMKYDIALTVLSVFPAIIASFVAFFIANRPHHSFRTFSAAGIMMGIGISTMHYAGMAAMRMEAEFVYKPLPFILSVCIAIIVSLVAIYIFSVKHHFFANRLMKLTAASVMGLAITSMHYIGMKALVFYVDNSSADLTHNMHQMDSTLLVASVTIGIGILLSLSIVAGILDKYVDHRLNYFDSLTKLANRRQFEKTLKANSGKTSFLAVLHIHGLEKWNSGFGYDFGDAIIRNISEILVSLKPSSIDLYRIEGNRFAIFTTDKYEFDSMKLTMERFSAIVKSPLLIKEQRPFIESVWVCSTSNNGETADQLFANTLAVLYHPSTAYKHEIIHYNPQVHTYTFEQSLLNDIERAMEEDELYLVYQPKVCPVTRKIKSFEALLRWNHSVEGPLSPAKFIPILEENGKMFDVTDWVIHKACKQISEWLETGKCTWHIAVNIPGVYVTSSRFKRTLLENTAKYDIDTKYLELEITETSVVSNIENAIRAMEDIRASGFTFALDDFGTGVSSLSYLKKLPISTIKIDKSFIDGVPNSRKDSSIIQAIISLCQSLDFNIVIEGVEVKEQVDFLTSMAERPLIQGYYFSKPLPAADVISFAEVFKNEKDSF